MADTEPSESTARAGRLLTAAASALAATGGALWLWSIVCRFPANPWNDLRLAPTIALAQGARIYPTATEGVVNTWTYGPLSVLAFWPASWASSAAGALVIASLLNLAVALGGIAAVCFAWPADAVEGSRAHRWLAFLLTAMLWPEWHYLNYMSDNLAVACGLVGSTLLARSQRPGALWAAAAFATAAVACKQIALGIPIAHALWLGLAHSWRTAGHYVVRCIVLGAVAVLAAVAFFGGPQLWFVLVALPAKFNWVDEPFVRFRSCLPALVEHLFVPLGLIVVFRRSLLSGTLLLATLLWFCALPLGLSALFKSGGRMNSVYSFLLWLPPVATCALLQRRSHARPSSVAAPAAATLAAAVACVQLILSPELPVLPQVAAYHEAETLAAKLPGRVWFPVHPLVTLYNDHRYYHDEDGLFVRAVTGQNLSPTHLWMHLPPDMSIIAFRRNYTTWGMAEQLLPHDALQYEFGSWTLRQPGPAPAAP